MLKSLDMNIQEAIVKKLENLPSDKQTEVLDFVDFLLTKQEVTPTQKQGKRIFGSAKGMIHMSEDFDAPLEDFKEYME
jgi:hypothetical protein